MVFRAIPIVFVFAWSTGWVVAGFSARHADPIWFLTLRFMFAGAVIALIALVLGSPWPRDRRVILHACASGVMIQAIYLGGVWWAVKNGVPSGVSGIMAGLQPVFTAMLAPFILGERITPIQAAGVALGFVGIVMVLAPKLAGIDAGTLLVIGVPLGVNLVAMVAVTLGSFYQKRFVSGGDLITTTFWQYAASAALMLPMVPLFGAFEAEWNLTLTLTMVWSVLALSVGGVLMFLTLIARGEVSRAAAYIYLVPLVASVMAYFFFGETLGPLQIAGMIVTAVGVYLATRVSA